MATNRTQLLDVLQEVHENVDIIVTGSSGNSAERKTSAYTAASLSRVDSPSRNRNYHTAFMQCRACCNCDSACSYYGKGHFDPRGNYIGP